MSNLPKLIVHIGTSKTGSTAIQVALKRSTEILAEQNVRFLGHMLENVPAALAYDWCEPGEAGAFFDQPKPRQATDEIADVALEALKEMGQAGVKTAIWSNEGFFKRGSLMIPIFRKLQDAGVEVQILTYIRRHDKWAQSAYVQFALKAKPYKGPLRRFAEWAQNVEKAPQLQEWVEAFPGNNAVYNFDQIDDVVAHFCEVTGLTGIDGGRANSSPNNALLTAWMVFNSRFRLAVTPKQFRKVARALDIAGPKEAGHPSAPTLTQMFPDTAELETLRDANQGDIDAINAILAENGQPPLDMSTLKPKSADVSSWEMEQLLLRAVFSLQEQVFELQDELEKLKSR